MVLVMVKKIEHDKSKSQVDRINKNKKMTSECQAYYLYKEDHKRNMEHMRSIMLE